MPPPKPAACLAAAFLGLRLLCVDANADGGAAQEGRREAVSFAAWVESGEFIGDEQLRRLYVSVGSNQCGFIVPSGLRVDLSRADRVDLMMPDLSYFITLRIGKSAAASLGLYDGFRQQALEDYPGAALTDEGTTEVEGRRGPTYYLRWKPAEGVDRTVTVAFVPTTAGVLEFSAVAETSKASEAQSALVGLLQRLQSGERGKFKMESPRQIGYN
jgi:hypothetical protein